MPPLPAHLALRRRSPTPTATRDARSPPRQLPSRRRKAFDLDAHYQKEVPDRRSPSPSPSRSSSLSTAPPSPLVATAALPSFSHSSSSSLSPTATRERSPRGRAEIKVSVARQGPPRLSRPNHFYPSYLRPLWTSDDEAASEDESALITDDESPKPLRTTLRAPSAWNELMLKPAKGKERANQGFAYPTKASNVATKNQRIPRIAVLSATYQDRMDYYSPDSSPDQRDHSLSSARNNSPSSSSSSSSSSRSSSPSSSASTVTLVTDPDVSPSPPSSASPKSVDDCLSPNCCQPATRTSTGSPLRYEILRLPHDPSQNSAPSGTRLQRGHSKLGRRSTAISYSDPTIPSGTFVPLGRDPLTAPRIDTSFAKLTSPPMDCSSQSHSPRWKRLASLFSSALDALSGVAVGNILLDGYTTSSPLSSPSFKPRRTLPPPVERDSLGLDKASLSPTDSPCLTSPCPSERSLAHSPTRPRNHLRRRSLRHSFSDPVLYHHHDRAPTLQRRKQAFGPHDIKPYGYRVGAFEVSTVFGGCFQCSHSGFKAPSVDTETNTKEEKDEHDHGLLSLSFLEFVFASSAQHAALLTLDGELSKSSEKSPAAEAHDSRPPSPPTPASIALQRYPIIPYFPTGSVSAEEEYFPKLRDHTKLWYLDLVPGGSDGKIDGGVPLSSAKPKTLKDDAGAIFQSFPECRRYASRSPRRRDGSVERRERRGRSTSPQRGRARTPRSLTGRQPCPSPPPASPVVRPRVVPSKTLSAKYFRAPPASDPPSMYLLWALKGSIALLPPDSASASGESEGWPRAQPLPPRRTRRNTSAAGANARKGSEGREGRGVTPGGVESLSLAGRRRVLSDGRVGSALRFEIRFEDDE
ncbi:hypothetical protein FRB99_001314 [Tulasnella sp. 403]|nr:hypothetical protein FRB99_001314 [Tulasnella sp. 403]